MWRSKIGKRDRAVRAFYLCAITISQGEFKRRHGYQFSSLDEIEVDPSEEMQLLASLEFGRDDAWDGSA